jgi:hypothetical protein
MMNAARVMRDAAEKNQRAADNIEESLRQMQMLYDPSYGGTATRLLTELNERTAHMQDMLHNVSRTAFDLDDTIGGEPFDEYVIRQVAKLQAQLAAAVAAKEQAERERDALAGRLASKGCPCWSQLPCPNEGACPDVDNHWLACWLKWAKEGR